MTQKNTPISKLQSLYTIPEAPKTNTLSYLNKKRKENRVFHLFRTIIKKKSIILANTNQPKHTHTRADSTAKKKEVFQRTRNTSHPTHQSQTRANPNKKEPKQPPILSLLASSLLRTTTSTRTKTKTTSRPAHTQRQPPSLAHASHSYAKPARESVMTPHNRPSLFCGPRIRIPQYQAQSPRLQRQTWLPFFCDVSLRHQRRCLRLPRKRAYDRPSGTRDDSLTRGRRGHRGARARGGRRRWAASRRSI